MSVLMWDKPKKAYSVEDWRDRSFDGGPSGGYRPNMSQTDIERWKAKLLGGAEPRVEIRKTLRGTQILIVVKKDTSPIPPSKRETAYERYRPGPAHDIRISMNGTLQLTFAEFHDMNLAIGEAREAIGP